LRDGLCGGSSSLFSVIHNLSKSFHPGGGGRWIPYNLLFYELWFLLSYPDLFPETKFAEVILAAQKMDINPEDLELFKEF